MSRFTTRPQRMTLMNLVTTKAVEPMFNPAEFEETIGVNYAQLQIQGLSHPVQHYTNTDAVKYSFELFYTCLGGTPAELTRIQQDRLFFKALTHPWRSPTIAKGGPPRVLFIWPNLCSLTCVVKSVGFRYTQFNASGAPIAYSVRMSIEEIRDVFVGMDDILSSGDFRSPGGHVSADDTIDLGEV